MHSLFLSFAIINFSLLLQSYSRPHCRLRIDEEGRISYDRNLSSLPSQVKEQTLMFQTIFANDLIIKCFLIVFIFRSSLQSARGKLQSYLSLDKLKVNLKISILKMRAVLPHRQTYFTVVMNYLSFYLWLPHVFIDLLSSRRFNINAPMFNDNKFPYWCISYLFSSKRSIACNSMFLFVSMSALL